MISFISSLEIINVVREAKFEGRCVRSGTLATPPDPNIFLWIAASVAAAANPNDIKTLLANGWNTFPIKGNPVFSNGPKGLPKNPPDCPVLCSWVLYCWVLY